MRKGVVGLALLLSAACTSGSPTSTGPTPTATAASPSSSPGAEAGMPATPSPSPSPDTPAITVVPGRFSGGFSTPSGNIQCDIAGDYARCDAAKQPWKPLPKTERCDLEWRTTIQLPSDAPAALRADCYQLVPRGPRPVLAYGHALQVGKVRCVSLQTELQCLVVGTKRGFAVNRNSYRLTAPTSGLATAPTPPTAGPITTAPAGFSADFGIGGRDWGGPCFMTDEMVSCIINATWKPARRKPPCGDSDGDPTPTIEIEHGIGRAVEDCRFDSNAGGPDLAVGHGIRIAQMECLARAMDVKCSDHRTGHGFVVSKAAFRAF